MKYVTKLKILSNRTRKFYYSEVFLLVCAQLLYRRNCFESLILIIRIQNNGYNYSIERIIFYCYNVELKLWKLINSNIRMKLLQRCNVDFGKKAFTNLFKFYKYIFENKTNSIFLYLFKKNQIELFRYLL